MKQLYSAQNGVEAHDLRLFLANHGIEAKVFGDNNALEIGFALTPASAPGVFVNERDFDSAAALLEQFKSRLATPSSNGAWVCAKCGEQIHDQFDICWNCEAPRTESCHKVDSFPPEPTTLEPTSAEAELSDAPSAPVATASQSSTARLWMQVVLMILLAQPFYSFTGHLLSWTLFPNAPRTFVDEWSYATLYNCVIAAIALCMMWLSREPWSAFGISKPLWSMDIIFGGLIYGVDRAVSFVAADLLQSFFVDLFGPEFVGVVPFRWVERPEGLGGMVALLVLSLAIAFAEELVSRGFLLARLERLFHSPTAGVLLSATVFGFSHWYGGPVLVGAAFVTGIVFGSFFVGTRRLWPVVIAHAVIDFSAFLYIGG